MFTLIMNTVNIPGVGCFGALMMDGALLANTVEREWLNNKPNISCIPAGRYDLVPHISPSKGECYALVNSDLGVTIHGPSQRTHILMHVANTPLQLQGCIGPGESFMNNAWGVANSKSAFDKIMALLQGQRCQIIINRNTAL